MGTSVDILDNVIICISLCLILIFVWRRFIQGGPPVVDIVYYRHGVSYTFVGVCANLPFLYNNKEIAYDY